MIEHGVVQEVRVAQYGSYLAVDAASGATALVLESILDFSEVGGRLTLNGVEYMYIAVDATTDTVTLSAGLAGAAVATDRVDIAPVAVDKLALVRILNAEETLTARVPHALMNRMPVGVRQADEAESVQFQEINGEFVIADVIGKQPRGLPLTQMLSAVCTTLLDLTTTETDVTGATVTFITNRPGASVLCLGSFYFSAAGATTSVGSGKLNVDGVTQAGFANFTGDAATQARANVQQTWPVMLAEAGSHTIKLRGSQGSGTGLRINTGSTTLTVLVFDE